MYIPNYTVRFEPLDEDFVLNNAHWIAYLSDGRIVYQDDDSKYELSSWQRLQNYISLSNENNVPLRLVRFEIKFRSNKISFDVSNEKAVYFSKGITKEWGDKQEKHYFVVGLLDTPDILKCRWYSLPELQENFIKSKEVSSELIYLGYLYLI